MQWPQKRQLPCCSPICGPEEVWASALREAGGGGGWWGWQGHCGGLWRWPACSPVAAEPLDVLAGWVSKPHSQGSFLAPFGVCGYLVVRCSLLTRRAHISPNQEVIGNTDSSSCPNPQPALEAALTCRGYRQRIEPCWNFYFEPWRIIHLSSSESRREDGFVENP